MTDRASVLLARVARTLQVDAGDPAVAYVASLRPSSRVTMARWLRVAAEFWGHSLAACPWHRLELAHVLALRSHVASKYAPATGNAILVGVRMVLRFAVRLGRMTLDAAHRAFDGVKKVSGERIRKGRHIERDELGRLFEAAAEAGPIRGPRDAAALALLAFGLRRSEAVAVDLADVDLDGAVLRVVKAKGNKQREVPISDDGVEVLRAWIAVRGEEPGPLLLPVRSGRAEMARLSDSGLYRATQAIARRAKVARLSPHDLRRTMIGQLLDDGADIKAIADLVGHASIEVTAKYDRRPERAKRRAANLIRLPFRRPAGSSQTPPAA